MIEKEKKSSKQSDTRVNWDFINSSAYHEKFKNLTNSDEVNETLYVKAIDMLHHRDGTEMEDLHLIDMNTGKVVASQTHSTVKNEVMVNKAVIRATKKYWGSLVGIHNHPNSKHPSGGDYASAKKRSYRKAYVICHNVTVYEYWYGKKNISSMLIDMKVAQKEQDFYNEDEAYEEALKELSRDYGIGWRKI